MENYDIRRKKLHICHQVTRNGKGEYYKDVPFTKGATDQGCRWVPVSSEAAKVLEELRGLNGNQKYILQGQGKAKMPITENRVNTHLKEFCEAAGVTYYSSHKFRFYGATEMYKAGVPLTTIQYYLGHSNLQTTIHYLRIKPEEADESIIEAIFG